MSVGERLAVGQVRGIHGLRGAVKVEILTDRPDERFRAGARLFREGSDESLTVASAHAAEPGWLVRFEEIADRAAADSLRDVYLEAVVAPGEELPRGEYYWHEIEGSRVLATDGRELGTVVDVYRAGAAEVFTVRGTPYGEFDVPAVRDFVRIFAPRRGEIVVDVEALELTPPEPKRPRGRRSSRGRVGAGPALTSTPALDGAPEEAGGAPEEAGGAPEAGSEGA